MLAIDLDPGSRPQPHTLNVSVVKPGRTLTMVGVGDAGESKQINHFTENELDWYVHMTHLINDAINDAE